MSAESDVGAICAQRFINATSRPCRADFLLSLLPAIQLHSALWLAGLSAANTSPQLSCATDTYLIRLPLCICWLAIWLFGMHALTGHANQTGLPIKLH